MEFPIKECKDISSNSRSYCCTIQSSRRSLKMQPPSAISSNFMVLVFISSLVENSFARILFIVAVKQYFLMCHFEIYMPSSCSGTDFYMQFFRTLFPLHGQLSVYINLMFWFCVGPLRPPLHFKTLLPKISFVQ